MRVVLLILVALITGCVGRETAGRVTEAIIYGPDRGLTVALYSYREGAGHWPASPGVLAKSPFLDAALHLEWYEGLKFEALDDGRMAVSFDRYLSPDGKVVWSKSRFELGEPAGRQPPATVDRPATTRLVAREAPWGPPGR